MNISMLDMANRNVEERKKLLYLLAELKMHGPANVLNITIDANRQDDTIVELVRPVIVGELRARVRRIEADLTQLGIELD